MKKIITCIFLFIVVFSLMNAGSLLLKNGKVFTFDEGVLEECDILIEDGKIKEIGKNLNTSASKIIDLGGKSIIPGIIDSHNHIGLSGGINEYTENVTPEINMSFQVNPDDPNIFYCLTGGVTMTHTMHGSSNPIGGENVVIKLKWGKEAEELIEKRALRTIKMALGENPKDTSGNYSYPASRMGVMSIIREAFIEAINYKKSWETYRKKIKETRKKNRWKILPPKKDIRKEVLLDLIDGDAVVRCHTYRADESLELIRLSKKFGFTIQAFEHFHQAYRIADELSKNNIGISIFVDNWNYKVEASEFTPFGLRILYDKGVEISLNSDNSEIMRRLYMEAGKMRRYAGMNELEALKTITLNPAKMLGLEKYVGSIEIGKDADLAVFDGHPLSSMSKCLMTMIEGEIYFDREKYQKQIKEYRKKKKTEENKEKEKTNEK